VGVLTWYWPEGHALQLVCVATFWYWPAAQLEHAEEPAVA
jgi:hypothetical protein